MEFLSKNKDKIDLPDTLRRFIESFTGFDDLVYIINQVNKLSGCYVCNCTGKICTVHTNKYVLGVFQELSNKFKKAMQACGEPVWVLYKLAATGSDMHPVDKIELFDRDQLANEIRDYEKVEMSRELIDKIVEYDPVEQRSTFMKLMIGEAGVNRGFVINFYREILKERKCKVLHPLKYEIVREFLNNKKDEVEHIEKAVDRGECFEDDGDA